MSEAPTAGFRSAATADAAAADWLGHPERLTGSPPDDVLAAWLDLDAPLDGPLIGLARAWEPRAATAALLHVVDHDPDDGRRDRAAWLLKRAAGAQAWRDLADRALRETTGRVPRRYLTEALTRLVVGREVAWDDLEPTAAALAADPDPRTREGAVGLLGTPPRTPRKRTLLLGLLADGDSAVVAGAAHALGGYAVAEAELDPGLARHLRTHPDPTVRGAYGDAVTA